MRLLPMVLLIVFVLGAGFIHAGEYSSVSNIFMLDTHTVSGVSAVSNIFTLDTHTVSGVSAMSNIFTLDTHTVSGVSAVSNIFTLDTSGQPSSQPSVANVTDLAEIDTFRTRFDQSTGQFSMMATWTNIGSETCSEPLQMVIENITPDTVTYANPDDTTLDGKSYYNYSNSVGDGKLEPGETSEARMIILNNPNRASFEFDISCWTAGGSNGGIAAPSRQQVKRIHIVIPGESALAQNYPNPFNPETWIPYELADPGHVSILIYDIQGRTVRTLELGYREIGQYFAKDESAYWDGRNTYGEKVGSGIYFYQLQAGDSKSVKKMVIAR
ncbi:T9SS type A sorting domain-containing protein [Candidatus Poribacteria bacterium]